MTQDAWQWVAIAVLFVAVFGLMRVGYKSLMLIADYIDEMDRKK